MGSIGLTWFFKASLVNVWKTLVIPLEILYIGGTEKKSLQKAYIK